jgi:hypothetical protein
LHSLQFIEAVEDVKTGLILHHSLYIPVFCHCYIAF